MVSPVENYEFFVNWLLKFLEYSKCLTLRVEETIRSQDLQPLASVMAQSQLTRLCWGEWIRWKIMTSSSTDYLCSWNIASAQRYMCFVSFLAECLSLIQVGIYHSCSKLAWPNLSPIQTVHVHRCLVPWQLCYMVGQTLPLQTQARYGARELFQLCVLHDRERELRVVGRVG